MCALDIRPAVATERLILRGPVAADVAPIAELANDLGVAGATTHLPYPYGQSDAEAFVGSVARMSPREHAVFAVEHRQFGVIGVLGFHEREPPAFGGTPMADLDLETRHSPREWQGRPELGYWFGRPFWGRGYATEAVSAALRWAKGDWRKNVVWAGHFADNRASGQVLCKAGFLYTGDVEPRESAGRGGQPVPTRMMVWLA